jgi:hypothetical protein
MDQKKYLPQLRQKLTDQFNETELRNLCFDLKGIDPEIDYDSLAGHGKADKARELVDYFFRRKLIPELIEFLRKNYQKIFNGDPDKPRPHQTKLVYNHRQAEQLMASVIEACRPSSTPLSQTSRDREFIPLDIHYDTILENIRDGHVVPFLGGDINMCGRLPGQIWQPGNKYLPSIKELSLYLAEAFGYPWSDKTELARVSQYIEFTAGLPALNMRLRKIFEVNYASSPVHDFFASLPGVLRARGYFPSQPLIVTTNYDDGLERAFKKVREPYDLLLYMVEGEYRNKFVHRTPDGQEHLIETANNYTGLWEDPQRTVIMKVHSMRWDSVFITEDHFIEFLSCMTIGDLVPATILKKLMNNYLLFLGYDLSGWNFRAVLHRIWGPRNNTGKNWWAVQFDPEPNVEKYGKKHGLEVIETSLEDYITTLSRRVLDMSSAGGIDEQ